MTGNETYLGLLPCWSVAWFVIRPPLLKTVATLGDIGAVVQDDPLQVWLRFHECYELLASIAWVISWLISPIAKLARVFRPNLILFVQGFDDEVLAYLAKLRIIRPSLLRVLVVNHG